MTRILAALALAIAFSSHALADSACDSQFLEGQRPALTAPSSADVELCNTAFVTLWSPATRDPVYSAEHLTAAGLTAADTTARLDAFHADARLPEDARATLRDYAGSRFDRGHMAPAHDMPTPAAMHESFVLSNMVPQSKPNNRGPWAQIEESARTLVVSVFGGPGGWVVTGPAFPADPTRLKGRIAIPDRIWKAIYVPGDPSQHVEIVVGAWIVKNAADPETRFVSLDALKAETGVDPFPSLSPELHATAALPAAARKRTGVE